jgi:hypothetical protein
MMVNWNQGAIAAFACSRFASVVMSLSLPKRTLTNHLSASKLDGYKTRRS